LGFAQLAIDGLLGLLASGVEIVARCAEHLRRDVKKGLHRSALLWRECAGCHVTGFDQVADVGQFVGDFKQGGRSFTLGSWLGLLACAWYTVGPRGRRGTLGLPGTDIFYTEHIPPAAPPHAGQPPTPKTGLYRIEHIPPAAPIHGGHRAAFAIVIVAIGLIIMLAGHG
jgi:hypothetical protein